VQVVDPSGEQQQEGAGGGGGEGDAKQEQEERAATLEYVLHELKDELYIELLEGFHK
jgi:hypothetical protein